MSEEGPGSGLSPDMIEKQYLGENITGKIWNSKHKKEHLHQNHYHLNESPKKD